MAQEQIVDLRHIGATYVSEETVGATNPFTTGTEVRLHPVEDTLDFERIQAELNNNRLQARAWAASDPIKGLKSGTAKLECYLQPAPTVLSASATVDPASAVPTFALLRSVFGERSVAAGSDVQTGLSTTSIDVTAAQGARFPTGQICAVVDGANGLVPCVVRERAADTLTLWPELSAPPGAGADVVNSWTFYPTRNNTRSFSLALASGASAGRQYRFNGGATGLDLTFARGELCKAAFDMKFATWAGPSALGLSTAVVADPMADPIPVRNARAFLQPPATTTRTCYPIDSLTLKLAPGTSHIEALTCAVEGVRGVARTEGLTETFCDFEVTFAADLDAETWWAERTRLAFLFYAYVDIAGGGRRMVTLSAGNTVVVNAPKHQKGAGNLEKTTITLRAKLNTYSGTPDVEALAEAPFLLSFI
jgi:hypothetical protein